MKNRHQKLFKDKFFKKNTYIVENFFNDKTAKVFSQIEQEMKNFNQRWKDKSGDIISQKYSSAFYSYLKKLLISRELYLGSVYVDEAFTWHVLGLENVHCYPLVQLNMSEEKDNIDNGVVFGKDDFLKIFIVAYDPDKQEAVYCTGYNDWGVLTFGGLKTQNLYIENNFLRSIDMR